VHLIGTGSAVRSMLFRLLSCGVLCGSGLNTPGRTHPGTQQVAEVAVLCRLLCQIPLPTTFCESLALIVAPDTWCTCRQFYHV
jgi:hypothetical protein